MPEIDLAGRKLGTSDILVGAGLILGLIALGNVGYFAGRRAQRQEAAV